MTITETDFLSRLRLLHARSGHHPVFREVVAPKRAHLERLDGRGISDLLTGLGEGAYDNPTPWLVALEEMHGEGVLVFPADSGSEGSPEHPSRHQAPKPSPANRRTAGAGGGLGYWGRFGFWFLLFSVVSVLLHERWSGPVSLSANNDQLYHAGLVIFLLSWLLSSGPGLQVWRQMGIWVAVIAVLILGYGYRGELRQVKDRFVGTLVPQVGWQGEANTMHFTKSDNRHFHIEARVNGLPVRFLVDTGASDIVLTPSTAQALGFDLDRLHFNRIYQTANGRGSGASVRLGEMRIGDLTLTNLPATVNGTPMTNSLLGMRFFDRLKGYRVAGNVLTIEW
ncbi:MAG: TIGR02281 family clan AA aspartic protease [Magnetococcales bacterium]|nr:TIGR02281 family clan AA aspartic protease [Magnetococcales bacterium]